MVKKAAVDDILTALADPARRGVVDLLLHGPRRAGELADRLGLTAPAMSRHLRVLRERGLIEDERPADDARIRLFRLKPEPFQALASWLGDVEAFWGEQLAAFKQHAEKRKRR